MFVNVVILFKDVVEVPDLDAPVDGGGDDGVLSAHHQTLDIHNALEMGVQHLGQLLRLHVPDIELLPDSRHCVLVLGREDKAAGDPGLLVHIPDIVRKQKILGLSAINTPELEAPHASSDGPLLIDRK